MHHQEPKKVNHSFKHLHFCHVLQMTVPSTLTVFVLFFFSSFLFGNVYFTLVFIIFHHFL